MKKVRYFEWNYNKETKKRTRDFVGEAIFHAFGCSFHEFESGAGNFSTALIELEDGSILNIAVEYIQFIKE